MQLISKKNKSKSKEAPLSSPKMINWFSTYGRLTIERLFENFNLSIHADELLSALDNKNSFYYKILILPFQHISNGLIMDQVSEYQIYAQKILIDFLLSGQNDPEEGAPGENVRESLEDERSNMMNLSDYFVTQKKDHKILIGKTQAALIKTTKKFMKTLKNIMNDEYFVYNNINLTTCNRIINTLLACQNKNNTIDSKGFDIIQKQFEIQLTEENKKHLQNIIEPLIAFTAKIDEINSQFSEQALDYRDNSRRLRTEFYELILRATELLQYLPDYTYNEEKSEKNRESLDFDRRILE